MSQNRVKEIAKELLPDGMWGWLREQRIRAEHALFARREVRHDYGGVPLRVLIADPLARGWYDRDWAPLREIELLRRRRLRPGARVFDLGAHQAVVAMMLGHVVGPTGTVVAVEADPHNVEIARENVARNEASQVELLHAAVSDRSGELLFGNEGRVGGDGERGVRVPCLTIDDLALVYGAPDVLFVDVEGYECHALRGASRVLARRPDCFVEVHVREGLERFGSVDELLAHFPDDAWELWAAPEDETVPFAPFARELPFLERRFFLVAAGRDGA